MITTSTNHYELTKKQLAILNFLYRFRFGTSDLLAKSIGINKNTINKRLRLMMELEYIGRNFEPEYHLLRKHAVYYLLPKGTKALRQAHNKRYSEKILRNIYKDKTASDQFVIHCLAAFEAYCILRARYGNELQFFTKSQLADFDHFPQPLPDAFIQFVDGNTRRQFFLDILHEHPFFVATRKVIQYAEYANDEREAWEEKTDSELPNSLLICDNISLQKRLLKRMRRIAIEAENNIKFYTTVTGGITSENAWCDMTRPDEMLSLDSIQ